MLIDVVCLLGRPCLCFFRFIGLCLSRVLETTFTSKANFFPKTLSKQLRKLELRVFACAINQAMIIATTQWRPSRMTTLHMRHAIFYSATGNCRLFLLALPGNLRYPFLSFLPFTFVLFLVSKLRTNRATPVTSDVFLQNTGLSWYVFDFGNVEVMSFSTDPGGH